MSETIHFPLLLAVELAADERPQRFLLTAEEVAGLVDRVAADLAKLVPGIEQLGFCLCASLLDPAQALRPGWPLFAELALQYERHARGREGAHLVGLGSAAGRMAAPVLEPEPGLGVGSLVVLPMLLLGDSAAIGAAAERLETVLEEQGLAGADTAWYLSRALSSKLEHARYLTLNDLCALTQMQLEHAGVDAGWAMIEAALHHSDERESAAGASGTPLVYRSGAVFLGVATYEDVAADLATDVPVAERADAFVFRKVEERMLQALLTAHGLAPTLVRAPRNGGTRLEDMPVVRDGVLIDTLAAPESGADPRIDLVTRPEVGVVVLLLSERAGDGRRLLAAAYPCGRGGLRLAREALRALAPTAEENETGQLALSVDGLRLVAEPTGATRPH